MDAIEGKTKIATWAINGEKETLVFDLVTKQINARIAALEPEDD